MSFAALKWSYTAPEILGAGLSTSELAVLRALCWFYNDRDRTRFSRNCYPGVKAIGAMTGLRASTIDAAKRHLQQLHLISWNRAANFEGGGADGQPNRDTNTYTINCPALDQILKRNEDEQRKARAALEARGNELEDCQEDPPITHPDQPGFLFNRPDPQTLIDAFAEPLSTLECAWMADALEFVGDHPPHRRALFAALRQSTCLADCRDALRRVRATSRAGRRIFNRLGYLLKSLPRAESAQSK